MSATSDSNCGNGSQGSPQTNINEQEYPSKAKEIDGNNNEPSLNYEPSPKHEPSHGWGSQNPIKSQEEGQKLLNEGIKDGKQIYNVTDEGKVVKFQPSGTPSNGFHAYEVTKPRDIPANVLKEMYNNGLISKSDYNKYRKGKK